MLYIILRGGWCNVVVLNVHSPCEDKSDDIKERFYEELGRIFHQFPRYDMKFFWGDFNAKIGIGNERSHEINNDNGVRVVAFAASKT
jgi:hypothetical protein